MLREMIRNLNHSKACGRAGLRKKILCAINGRKGKFTAVQIAEEIGYTLKHEGVYPTCPNVRRMLTQLCKEGLLYQWITGNGMSPFAISEVPTYDVNYLLRTSELAEVLINHPNRILNGYRIR
jgi:hypothetical protein